MVLRISIDRRRQQGVTRNWVDRRMKMWRERLLAVAVDLTSADTNIRKKSSTKN
jgi:hypothetical protein